MGTTDVPKSVIYTPVGFNDLATVELEGIKYNLGLDNAKKILYIQSSDPNFTVEGLKTGDPVGSFYKQDKINLIRGWGYFVPINSKWYAAMDFKEEPTQDSPILFFFQYDFSSLILNK